MSTTLVSTPLNVRWTNLQRRVQRNLSTTTPIEWLGSISANLIGCMLLHYLGRDSSHGFFNFHVIFYTLILTLITQLVKGEELHNQYAWSVVLISLFEAILPRSRFFYSFVLGLFPLLARYTIANIPQHAAASVEVITPTEGKKAVNIELDTRTAAANVVKEE